MTEALTFSPLFPWSFILALGLIFGGLVLVSFVGRARRGAGAGDRWGMIWRVVVATAMLTALSNPRVIEERRERLNDIAVVVVDRSQSQNIGSRSAQTDQALARLKSELGKRKNLQVRVVAVGNRGEDGTHLMSALDLALADVPRGRLAGSVLITDGQVHDVDRFRPPSGTPVHVLLTGKRQEVDRRLVLEQAPAYGIVGKKITLTYRIEDHGVVKAKAGQGSTGEVVRVTVRLDGKLVASVEAITGRENKFSVTLEHAGNNVIEMEAAALDGELSLLNNHVVTTVNGIRDRLKVMLISGLPHAGERTWRNLLKSDPSVDLVHFTILRPPEINDRTPINELSLISFPTQELFEKKLGDFDLIVFDRYVNRGALPAIYYNNIDSYLLNGGAILFADGPEYSTPFSFFKTSLGKIMPFEPLGAALEQGFRPHVTAMGHRHPVTAGLDVSGKERWGRWFRQVPVRARFGKVLMTGIDGIPLLALGRIGKGRVAQLSSDQIWLWARGFEGGGPHVELVRRLAHWLMKEPELEEERLSARVENAKLRITRHSLDPGPLEVTVSAPSGAAWNIPLSPSKAGDGTARASLDVHEIGLYRIEDGTRVALAASGPPNPKEVQDLRSSAAPLAPLVKATGGGMFWLQDGMPDVRFTGPGHDARGKGWIGMIENGASAVTGATEKPLLPDLVVLMLVLAGLAAAWWREGR